MRGKLWCCVMIATLVAAMGVPSTANAVDTATVLPQPTAQVDTVILAYGRNFPDALAGSILSYACDAPVMLTETAVLPLEVKNEIKALGASKVIILGGEGVVGAGIVTALNGIGITDIERIGGGNRFHTSALIAARGAVAVQQAKGARIAEIQTRISFALTGVQAQIDALAARVSGTESDIDSIKGDISSIETSVSAYGKAIGSLETSMTAADDGILDLNARIDTLELVVADAVAGLHTHITSLLDRMMSAEGLIDSLGVELVGVKGSTESLETSVGVLSYGVTDLGGRVSVLEVGSLSDTPTVDARQLGDWTMHLAEAQSVGAVQSGQWDINVANSPTVKLDPANSTVRVSNDVNTPVYVQAIGSAAKTPFSTVLGGPITQADVAPGYSDFTYVTPSDGQWFVIKTIGCVMYGDETANSSLTNAAIYASARLTVEQGANVLGIYPQPIQSSGQISSTEACDIAVPASSLLRFRVRGQSLAGRVAYMTLTGYTSAEPY